jgi:type II secretory pathway component PulM
MKHPREPFERLLDVFDDSFKRAAAEHGFVFDPGVHKVTRAIRLKDDRLERGVFLRLKAHWMQSDPIDPEVVLHYGAWSSSHVLIKSFYDGKLSELTRCIDAKLQQAVSELKTVSEEIVGRDGESLEGLRTGAVEL